MLYKIPTKYRELVKEDVIKKKISYSFWKNASITSKEKKTDLLCCTDTQPKACRSVQPFKRPFNLP
jgi:hypothetical protein